MMKGKIETDKGKKKDRIYNYYYNKSKHLEVRPINTTWTVIFVASLVKNYLRSTAYNTATYWKNTFMSLSNENHLKFFLFV